MRETAAAFSEEDLTRYLQLTLDLFKDLQSSLQPRLHLEIGLLKLVHVGKLLPIEQALAGMSGPPAKNTPSQQTPKPPSQPPPVRTGPSPFRADSSRKFATPTAPPPPRPAPVAAPVVSAAPAPVASVGGSAGDIKSKLYTALIDLSMAFTADALEHSQVTEAADGITVITPKEFSLDMTEPDMRKAAQQALGRPVRVKIVFGEPVLSAAPLEKKPKVSAAEEEVSQRALSHPDVQRFQELFPDAQVRAVRNLKE
jgi:DNA polymerase-3 subunit gamma/tau